MNRKLRYLRDRVVNAYWMVRRGELKSIFGAVFQELRHRVESVQAWWYKRRRIDFSKIPGSAYADSRKVSTSSYRPTHSTLLDHVPVKPDREALAREINELRSSFEISGPGKS